MFDRILTFLLQAIIIIDIFGAIAYFVMGGLKHQKRQALQTTLPTPNDGPTRSSPGKKRFSFFKPLPWKRSSRTAATERDFTQLRRILWSFEQDLKGKNE